MCIVLHTRLSLYTLDYAPRSAVCVITPALQHPTCLVGSSARLHSPSPIRTPATHPCVIPTPRRLHPSPCATRHPSM
ncbi:hypothetical protein C2E23DRAFT_833511, partial [Lenzites betulinus]